MSDDAMPQSSIILYQTEDGRTRIQCRFQDETIWLTQKLIAELFQVSVKTVNEHLVNIYEEGELSPQAVIRKFRITATDGKNYDTQHYNLEAILAVGKAGFKAAVSLGSPRNYAENGVLARERSRNPS